jgi:ABC-type antimicrobial peptide transport system permease subunit
LRGEPDLVVYQPVSAAFQTNIVLTVKSDRPPRDVEALVRRVVAEVDPSLPLQRTELLTESVARNVAAERVFARLVSILATLAAVLAAVGLYSVIAYAVAERTREIGIRMALGAGARTIVGMVVRQAVRVVIVGVVIGIALASAISRMLENRLFGVAPLDLLTYTGAATLLIGLAGIASAQPAHAATRVNPIDALRHD